MDYLIAAAFFGVACYYPVCVMLLNFKGGPFTKYGFVVVDEWAHLGDNGLPSGEVEIWHINLFDRIRSKFDVYEDHTTYWKIKRNNWSELFRCPYCLSFWFAFPFSIFLGFYSGEWLWVPIYHLIVTSVSITMNRYV